VTTATAPAPTTPAAQPGFVRRHRSTLVILVAVHSSSRNPFAFFINSFFCLQNPN